MKYFDLHCDALTCSGVASVTKESLSSGGCALQCFAAFLSKERDRLENFLALADRFDALCNQNGFLPVKSLSDLLCGSNKIKAMLTFEGGGVLEGDLKNLEILFSRGVRLMTLTWNYQSELGYPAFLNYDAWRAGKREGEMCERARGLTNFGKEAVEAMCALGIGADVSHGSLKLLRDVAEICKARRKPFFATHSNAAAVFPCPRNLDDGGIRLIAESGGVVGLCFCADFLSNKNTISAQKQALIMHARNIINVGGEDCLAIGSDFDGIEPNPFIPSPAFVPRLLENFNGRVAEKIAYRNALRAFSLLLS